MIETLNESRNNGAQILYSCDPLLRLRVKSERKCSKETGNKNGNYADKQNIPPNSILA
jgi:hypothetical protein